LSLSEKLARYLIMNMSQCVGDKERNTSSDLQEKVINVVVETLKVDRNKVSPEDRFVEDLGADSLDQVELVMAFEAAFDCEIPQEEAEKITSVSQAVAYLGKALEGQSGFKEKSH
jgi:acyl carrier protein